MKNIFISYSRADGGDFADYIKEHYEKEGHQVFVYSYDTKPRADWSESIRNSLAQSDIVVVIVTRYALKSSEVEKEVLEAKKQNKIIIPCRYRGILWTDLKWDLNKLQGFEFDNKNSLIRQLDEIIFSENSSAISMSSPLPEDKGRVQTSLKYNAWRNWLPAFLQNRKSQTPTSPAKPPKSTTGAEPPTDTINPKDISFTKNKKNDSKEQTSESGLTRINRTVLPEPLVPKDYNEITSPKLKIERYPYARFPSIVDLNEVIPLEIRIISFKPSSSNYKDTTSITLQVNEENQKEIPVQVIVECDDDGFEIDGKYYATINVPVDIKDSNPIIFNIKSNKEGKHTIQISFYQQATYVGEIKIESFVAPSKNEKSVSKSSYEINLWKSDYAMLEKIIPGPDITIFIHERKISSDFEYDVLVSSLDIPIQEMGPVKFQFNPETKFHKLFEDVENLNSPSVTIVDRKIKAKGMSLYDELFPESLKELYWEKRDKIKSIRVISKEPWIPWEIIKPWHKLENGIIEEDDFLCEHYAFSRWIVGKPERIKVEIKNVKVTVPKDTNLDAAIKERDWIEEFVKAKNIKISFDSSYEQVINTLETEKEIDILHFSTHGQNNTESPLLSAIELEGKVQLRPEEIVGKAVTFGQSYPIVILNACQTGIQGFSLTGIQGWATKFLEAGASAFIGTLWSVNDETAFKFVQEFYNELITGTSLGESVKNARNKCKKEGDTSWLAYQLYGHPNSTIKF